MIRRQFQKAIFNRVDVSVLLLLLLFFAGGVWGSRLAHLQSQAVDWAAWLDGFLQNFGTEMFGAFLTFLLIEQVVAKRDRRRDLIQDIASGDNATALRAVAELRERMWLGDGSLRWVDLRAANLEGANLEEANLKWARLGGANLVGANLEEANLKWARLGGANLVGADLRQANLVGANLHGASLQGAALSGAKLEGADLWRAKLEGARLIRAKLEGADLRFAKLEGALFLTVDQLRSAETLKAAKLPDGTELPDDDTWQDEFEHWVEHTAQFKERDMALGKRIYIVPTRTEANAESWDFHYGDGE